jgi:hypothetical protein
MAVRSDKQSNASSYDPNQTRPVIGRASDGFSLKLLALPPKRKVMRNSLRSSAQIMSLG